MSLSKIHLTLHWWGGVGGLPAWRGRGGCRCSPKSALQSVGTDVGLKSCPISLKVVQLPSTHGSFYFKSATFQNSRKICIIFGQLLKKELWPRSFKNITLPPLWTKKSSQLSRLKSVSPQRDCHQGLALLLPGFKQLIGCNVLVGSNYRLHSQCYKAFVGWTSRMPTAFCKRKLQL